MQDRRLPSSSATAKYVVSPSETAERSRLRVDLRKASRSKPTNLGSPKRSSLAAKAASVASVSRVTLSSFELSSDLFGSGALVKLVRASFGDLPDPLGEPRLAEHLARLRPGAFGS